MTSIAIVDIGRSGFGERVDGMIVIPTSAGLLSGYPGTSACVSIVMSFSE